MVVNIVAILSPASGKEARVEELVRNLTSEVEKTEPNVEKYIAFKRKTADGLTEFVFQERYKDQETLKVHTATDHFKVLGKAIAEEGLLVKPLNIMILEPVSGFDGR